ncbi:CxxC motif-containing protein [Lachnospiraceae bacterium NK3A20]|nr:CxxC motif-containing protein [Lachnospiraceae bacterium NK3A20]
MSEEKRNLTCIRCPMGCQITVTLESGEVRAVEGNSCPRGDEYARNEVTHPVRTVTSTVRVRKGSLPVVSVKTQTDIPKDRIFDVMRDINSVTVTAPVHIGDVLMENIAGTGVALVATRDVPAA